MKIISGKYKGRVLEGFDIAGTRPTMDRVKESLFAMIQSYFALGAFHVQFNTVSTETLRKAQAHPEDYKDLLVRVAGYSTQFVNLSKSMQDSIIARNAHETF